MNHDDLRHWSKRAADWAHDYHTHLRDRPVRPDTQPGDTAAKLPSAPPEHATDPAEIFADFEAIVPDAMTHWQHPRFFAYFPANAAPASQWAEQLANAMAAQCMLWQTSPAATEIEQVMVSWLRQALGLADHFTGTIHDTATTCTLAAVITMRDRATGWDSVDRRHHRRHAAAHLCQRPDPFLGRQGGAAGGDRAGQSGEDRHRCRLRDGPRRTRRRDQRRPGGRADARRAW